MTDAPDASGQTPLTESEIDAGEREAGPHDPDPAEQYAGVAVPDPWEEVNDGELDPGALPGEPAD
jgi:hypothetical protein